MTIPFIYIRYKQISRTLSQLGLGRVVFLMALIAVLLIASFSFTAIWKSAVVISSIYLFAIFILHIKRPDKHFIEHHFTNYQWIFYQEYLFLLIPLLIGIVFHGHFFILPVLLGMPLLIIRTKIQFKSPVFNTKIQQLIPDECFEWKSGIRKTFVIFISVWVLGIGFSLLIGGALAAMFILLFLSIGFYEKTEPLNFILCFEMSPSQFLKHKLKTMTMLFSFINIPLALAFLTFHSNYWYLVVALFFINLSISIFAVLLKYAFYQPNSTSGAIPIYQSIAAISALIPVLLPLIWLLSLKFYFSSIQNLNQYLYDFD